MNATGQGNDWTRHVLVALGFTAGIAGLWRVFGPETITERIDHITLSYFGVAGLLVVLWRVRSLSFGGNMIQLEQIEARVEEALEEAKTDASLIQAAAIPISPTPTSPTSFRNARQDSIEVGADSPNLLVSWDRQPGKESDDPWKGAFGGRSESGHRRLKASVVPMISEKGWYRVHIWVESTDPKRHPLKDKGLVRFFIHDTFPEPKRWVPVVENVAQLRLRAWGSFTVGALILHR